MSPALLIIVCVGAVVRFATLGTQGFWVDEANAIEVITSEPAEMLRRIADAEANPPLYFLLAATWERMFGSGEVALRSLSALLGTATIPVVFAAGRALGSRRTGLVAAALTAASPFLIWYAQEARGYALVLFLSAVSFLCFAQLLEGRSSRWLWGWAIASILALCTHYYAAVLIAAEAGWLLWTRPRSRPQVGRATAAVVAVALALAPLAVAQRDLTAWVSTLDLGERLLQLPQHFVVGMSAPWQAVGPIAVGVVLAASALALARGDGPSRRAATVAGGVLAIGTGLALGAAVAGADSLLSRNLIVLWPAFAVALAALLSAPSVRPGGPAVAVALCALGLALAVWTSLTPSTGRPDWDQLSDELGPPPGERLVVSPPLTSGLGLYLDGSRRIFSGDSVSARELDLIALREIDDHSIGPCWWLGFCGGEQVLDVSQAPFPVPARFELVDRGSTDLFEYRRYRGPRPVELGIGTTGYGDLFLQAPP